MKQENEFVLPEKWSIIGCHELVDFLQSIGVKSLGYDNTKCYYIDSKGVWDYFPKDSVCSFFYPTITFEQFKEHVLKEPNDVYSNSEFNSERFETKCGHVYTEDKKLIGYKLIKEEYKKAIREIIKFSGNESWYDSYFESNLEKKGRNFSNDDTNLIKNTLETAGVLDLWFEPVYDESITLKSGKTLTASEIDEVKEILKNK